jgi:hypothetical protein
MGPTAPLVTCHRHETLHRVLELFCATNGRCERLICVDEHSRCTGIVSLSDVFAYLSSDGPIVPRPLVSSGVGVGVGLGRAWPPAAASAPGMGGDSPVVGLPMAQ